MWTEHFDFLDAVRVLCAVLNIYTVWVLASRWREGKYVGTNQKTRDLWFTQVMWTTAGAVFAIQGIALDRPFTAGFVFLIAATLVGAKAVHIKGPWGTHDTQNT